MTSGCRSMRVRGGALLLLRAALDTRLLASGRLALSAGRASIQPLRHRFSSFLRAGLPRLCSLCRTILRREVGSYAKVS